MKKPAALPLIILLGILFGTNLVISRFGLGQFHPITFNSLRLILASICYIVLFSFSGRWTWPRQRSLWQKAGLWGAVALASSMSLFVSSLRFQSAGVTSLLIAAGPIFTVIAAHFFLSDERMTRNKLFGVLLAFAGAAIILITRQDGLSTMPTSEWRGYAMVMTANLIMAFGFIYGRLKLRHEDPVQVAGVRIFGAAASLFVFTLLFIGYDFSKVQLSGWLALLAAGTITTFFPFLIEVILVQRFGALAASQSAYVQPVVSMFLGWLFLGERITLLILLGMAITFVGLAFLNKNGNRTQSIE